MSFNREEPSQRVEKAILLKRNAWNVTAGLVAFSLVQLHVRQ